MRGRTKAAPRGSETVMRFVSSVHRAHRLRDRTHSLRKKRKTETTALFNGTELHNSSDSTGVHDTERPQRFKRGNLFPRGKPWPISEEFDLQL